MLDFMPKMLYLLMRNKFKDAKVEAEPSDVKGFYDAIESILN